MRFHLVRTNPQRGNLIKLHKKLWTDPNIRDEGIRNVYEEVKHLKAVLSKDVYCPDGVDRD